MEDFQAKKQKKISSKVSATLLFILLIANNQNYRKRDEIGIAIIDSGFNGNCQQYFENEIIEYDATGEENNSDITGHGGPDYRKELWKRGI